MLQTFNRLDGIYLRVLFLFIDAIMKDQLGKYSEAEIEKNEQINKLQKE